MNTKNAIKGDYRKWLLYSFEKQDFNEHYSLYKALKEGASTGGVQVLQKSDEGGVHYLIGHDNISDDLEINKEQLNSFKDYLIENYFKTEKIDELFNQRTQGFEKEKNHYFIESKSTAYAEEQEFQIKVHPKESTYFGIKLIFSVLIYVALLITIVSFVILNPDPASLIGLALIIPVVFTFWLLQKIVMGLFVGLIRGNSIQVTKDQFPEIYNIVEEQAAKMKIKKLPEIYIASGHFNAFVTRFSRSNILMLFSEVIETTLNGNYDVLRYVTAHELCHIKQNHLSKRAYLFPSKLVPFLGLAYSRGCEYTCDRVGYSLSPKGSIEGILIMTTGKEIHSKFNIELHIKNSIENAGFWTWFSEKFLTHPHLYKRLVAIKQFSKYN